MLIRSSFLVMLCLSPLALQRTQDSVSAQPSTLGHPNEGTPVSAGAILVRGAWPSASNDEAPRPESSRIENNRFLSPYFGISYPLPDHLEQGYLGPPPSEDGRYVLAEASATGEFQRQGAMHLLITAEDLFFSRVPIEGAAAFVDGIRTHLDSEYHVERSTQTLLIDGHSFWTLQYNSQASQLHWNILATDLRCHVVSFIFTSHSSLQPSDLAADMRNIRLSVGSPKQLNESQDEFPVCIKNYVGAQNVLTRIEPNLSRDTFNRIPVRILIDKGGNVADIHILSAFPDQSKVIIDAVERWKFKPYLVDGHAVPVETNLVFGPPISETSLQIRRPR